MPGRKKAEASHERGRYRLDPKLYEQILEAASANDMSLREYTKRVLAASLGKCPTCGAKRPGQLRKETQKRRQPAAESWHEPGVESTWCSKSLEDAARGRSE
jgi:hypothetical protein